MREASYVQLQYLFEMVHMAKPCFGTSTRLPSIVMLKYLSVKNFIQGRVRVTMSPNCHRHNLFRGSTEYLLKFYNTLTRDKR